MDSALVFEGGIGLRYAPVTDPITPTVPSTQDMSERILAYSVELSETLAPFTYLSLQSTFTLGTRTRAMEIMWVVSRRARITLAVYHSALSLFDRVLTCCDIHKHKGLLLAMTSLYLAW